MVKAILGQQFKTPAFWFGLLFIAIIAYVGGVLATIPAISKIGLSALTIAILIGIVIGNTIFPKFATLVAPGVDYSKNILLRLGIILYGFNITFQEIGAVGWSGLIIALLMIGLTFSLAVTLGIKVFKLDSETAILIGAGSSICGAAAVMATEPVVKAQAHKVSVAVATVVVFGTIAMFIYPLLYPYLGLSEHAYGVYAGSTIHEVAQVVVAGENVGKVAGESAVIEKMLRVMLLAPFLVLLSTFRPNKEKGHKAKIMIPWFAVLFIVVAIVHSVVSIPQNILHWIKVVDIFLLTMAMAALGIRTHMSAVKEAGVKPLLLAAFVFVFLMVGGYGVNQMVGYVL